MDAEWELVERSRSINALAQRDAKLSELDAAKREGNASFQHKRFADAAKKYSFVIDCCIDKLAHAAHSDSRECPELSAVAAMEVAVRLNRALAFIELREFASAEDDCAAVLAKQCGCVKALYRRALAREQLGDTSGATEDLAALLKLEPANPAALQMRDRLQTKQRAVSKTHAAVDESDVLVSEVRSCSLTNEKPAATRSRIELAEAAEAAWKLLQEEELLMRRAFEAKKPAAVSRQKQPQQKQQHASASSNAAAFAPANQRQPCNNHQQASSSVFKSKTNDLWESLAQEEHNTVAKVYQKRRPSAKSK